MKVIILLIIMYFVNSLYIQHNVNSQKIVLKTIKKYINKTYHIPKWKIKTDTKLSNLGIDNDLKMMDLKMSLQE